MKDCTSYVAPLVGLAVLITCDYQFWSINNTGTLNYLNIPLLLIYNLICLMAIFSLLMTMFSNPGHLPKNYHYDSSQLSRTTAALFKFA
jgi:hypothetical protein